MARGEGGRAVQRRHLVSSFFAVGAGVAVAFLALGSGTALAASWTAPGTIDGTNSLKSISCPTASFCAAVDSTGHVVTHQGTSWSTVTQPDTSTLNSVSCTSASFCVAVDSGDFAVIY